MAIDPISAGIMVGGNILGGLMGRRSARRAAQAQANAAAAARAQQERIQARQEEINRPWLSAGQRAMEELSDPNLRWDDTFDEQKFVTSPGFNTRLAAGSRALERTAASRGGLFSGQTLKALTRYNQEQTMNEFDNARDRWRQDRQDAWARRSELAGMGERAVGRIGQSLDRLGGQYGQTYGAEGDARAAGRVAGDNAVIGAVEGIANTWGRSRVRPQPYRASWDRPGQ